MHRSCTLITERTLCTTAVESKNKYVLQSLYFSARIERSCQVTYSPAGCFDQASAWPSSAIVAEYVIRHQVQGPLSSLATSFLANQGHANYGCFTGPPLLLALAYESPDAADVQGQPWNLVGPEDAQLRIFRSRSAELTFDISQERQDSSSASGIIGAAMAKREVNSRGILTCVHFALVNHLQNTPGSHPMGFTSDRH